MITNFSFGVPCETADADYPMPLGDYFDIEKDMMQVGGEFLLVRDEESNFYFLCTDDCDIEILCRAYDWYIVSSGRFNGRLRIGMGWPERMLTAARCSGSRTSRPFGCGTTF